jgi:hypothetical protein
MTKANSTELIFLVDRSGSMTAIADDMRGGFDDFIRKQREVPGDCRVSLFRFDDRFDVVFTSLALSAVPPLELEPRNTTALHDAMCRAIDETGRRFAKMPEAERPEKVLFIAITDGYENASREFHAPDVRNRIAVQERDYKWQFIFLGANQEAVLVAQDLGIRAGNAATYQASRVGTKALFGSMGSNVRRVRKGLVSIDKEDLFNQASYDAALADEDKKEPNAPPWPTSASGTPPVDPKP